MEKILTILILMVLVSSFALAEGNNTDTNNNEQSPTLTNANGEGAPQGNGSGDALQIKKEVRNQSGDGEGLMLRGKNSAKLQIGLENALTNVKNEQARQVLEQNMNKFAEKYQNRLANMNDIEIEADEETGAAMIQAKEEARFLGLFKAQKTKKFEISADGEIKEKKSFFNFMYSKTKSE